MTVEGCRTGRCQWAGDACSLSPAKPSYSAGSASVCDGAHRLKLRPRLPLRSRVDRCRGCNDAPVVIAVAERWAGLFLQRTSAGTIFGDLAVQLAVIAPEPSPWSALTKQVLNPVVSPDHHRVQ